MRDLKSAKATKIGLCPHFVIPNYPFSRTINVYSMADIQNVAMINSERCPVPVRTGIIEISLKICYYQQTESKTALSDCDYVSSMQVDRVIYYCYEIAIATGKRAPKAGTAPSKRTHRPDSGPAWKSAAASSSRAPARSR